MIYRHLNWLWRCVCALLLIHWRCSDLRTAESREQLSWPRRRSYTKRWSLVRRPLSSSSDCYKLRVTLRNAPVVSHFELWRWIQKNSINGNLVYIHVVDCFRFVELENGYRAMCVHHLFSFFRVSLKETRRRISRKIKRGDGWGKKKKKKK